MSITVSHIHKDFSDFTALKDVSLEIQPGELIALLGPSGSGKTTLLRIIAGLEHPDSGEVTLHGVESNDAHVRERHVGFVFQHYALFRHMTVFENVAFGLRVRKRNERPQESQIRHRVLELLRLVHLEGLHERYPSQLSGGQRQRVALARALAVEPKVLLLDEPFGALDAKVRKELRRWMRRLHEEMHITTIFVTHDQEEAMEMSDRVVVMSNGRIEQVGTPSELWNTPRNAFVYDFLGNYNQFEGWKDSNGTVHLTEYGLIGPESGATDRKVSSVQMDSWWRRYPLAGQLVPQWVSSLIKREEEVSSPEHRFKALHGEGKRVNLFARPHEMFILKKTPETTLDQEYITATIIHLNPAGPLVKLELERPNGALLQAEIPADVVKSLELQRNDEVYVRPKQTRVFE